MKVLIVGLGSIGLKHAGALRTLVPDLELYALRSSETSSAFAEGITNFYSWNEIRIQPDFIIISNPTSFHRAAISNALLFNCPLFIEKPVLHNLAESEQLQSLISKSNTITYVACNLRFHPVIQYLKKCVTDDNIGVQEVNIYCGSYLPDWRKNKDYTTTYSANKEMGGGVHLDLIHELDYCYWLFGNPSDTISLRRQVSSLNINTVDSASYLLVYPGFTANVTLNYFRRDSKRSIEIVTENNTLYGDLLNARVDIAGNTEFFAEDYTMIQTYTDQMKYFLENLHASAPPMNSFKEALNVLKIALQ